jgi:hypothetical protein
MSRCGVFDVDIDAMPRGNNNPTVFTIDGAPQSATLNNQVATKIDPFSMEAPGVSRSSSGISFQSNTGSHNEGGDGNVASNGGSNFGATLDWCLCCCKRIDSSGANIKYQPVLPDEEF